jgi:hypothetical protein
MNQPASFSSLPPELVAKICGDSGLEKKDLVALRLTGKTQGVHASATKAFAKRYFTDVLLLYNKYSLETFVKISQHPVFGPSIRKIQLSCARYDKDDFYITVDDMKATCDGHREFAEVIQLLSRRCDDDETFHDADGLLEQGLAHLAESNRSLVLAVSTNEDKSIGSSKTWASDMSSGGWEADPCHYLDLLLDAADRSNCKIRKIEAKVDIETYSAWEVGDNHWVFPWKRSESVRSISELTIDMMATAINNRYHEFFAMIRSLLSLATCLKSLHIRANIFNQEETGFEDLAESISSLPLEELHLTDLCMRATSIVDLLQDLGSSLCSLKILDCNIAGSWKQILLCIQQYALRLDKLQISGTGREWLGGSVVYNGIAGVRLGVIELLQVREEMVRIYQTEDISETES